VARHLAEQLGWQWADADELLEARAGRSIRRIFQEEGEPAFRLLESAVLADLCRLRRHVVATGGGVVLDEANRRCMRAAGRVIWLGADPETLWQRIQADATSTDRRPDLTIGGRAELEQLLQLRVPHYRACADCCIETTGRSPAEIAHEIRTLIRG